MLTVGALHFTVTLIDEKLVFDILAHSIKSHVYSANSLINIFSSACI